MSASPLPPDFVSGVPALDELHEEFFTALQGLSSTPDSEFERRYGEFVRQAEHAFATEEEWMEELDLPALPVHREQHARVLGALHHVNSRVMEGDLNIGRDVIRRLLPRWFTLHMATMDAPLASAMRNAHDHAEFA